MKKCTDCTRHIKTIVAQYQRRQPEIVETKLEILQKSWLRKKAEEIAFADRMDIKKFYCTEDCYGQKSSGAIELLTSSTLLTDKDAFLERRTDDTS